MGRSKPRPSCNERSLLVGPADGVLVEGIGQNTKCIYAQHNIIYYDIYILEFN